MIANVRMFFHIEGLWVEVTSDHALARKDLRHGFTKYIRDNAYEDIGDVDRLWFEVENLLENRCEDRQSEAPVFNVSSIMTSSSM